MQAWDTALFYWINRDWASPVLDPVMAFLSGNRLFGPALVVLAIGLLWKGGRRGVVFVVLLGLGAALANELVVEPLKDGVARLRPYAAMDDVLLRVGRGNPRGSFPSAHALNCALIATLAGWYYRRSLWFGIPVAVGVALSRVYNGVHFPSDVLAGAALGVGSGFVILGGAEAAWRRWVPARFPRAARWLPSLRHPDAGRDSGAEGAGTGAADGTSP